MTRAEYDAYKARRLTSTGGNREAISSAGTGNGAPPERKLHETIMADCKRLGWICLHGAMSTRTHRTLGEPDFVVLANYGRVYLIECKSAKGKLTHEQNSMALQAHCLGHGIHLVRSVEDWRTLASIKKEDLE